MGLEPMPGTPESVQILEYENHMLIFWKFWINMLDIALYRQNSK